MAFNINDFRTRGLSNGGVRPSLFQVEISPPSSISADSTIRQKFTFTCSASQIPDASISEIAVSYFGRQIKLAGERAYQNWSVTILNDEDFSVRNMFESWSNEINQFVGNVKRTRGNAYKNSIATVKQFSSSGGVIRAYVFNGIFPISVGAIGLGWDQTSQIQNFDVTFAYDYWTPQVVGSGTINTGQSGGDPSPPEAAAPLQPSGGATPDGSGTQGPNQ